MVKYLKNKKGDGSVVPILLVMSVTLVSMLYIFYHQIDNSIVGMQKDRYSKAVDMAVNTAMATIELSAEKDINEETNLEKIALGYTLDKRLVVDKDKFKDIFYNVLFRNVQIVIGNTYKEEAFKRYVPLKAIIQYDTISLSTYDDQWRDYRLFYTDETTGQKVFLTLGEQCYTINENLPEEERFQEVNKQYITISEAKRNIELTKAIRVEMEDFVNAYKVNHYDYNINIPSFDSHKFSGAVNDVTFFCLVEGIPIRSFLSKEPDRSFYCFSFGGASLRRADD